MGGDELLRRAHAGDPAAVEELCRREWRPVYATVYRAVRDRAEAEDLTQEVFVRALRALDRYRESAVPFQGFLAVIARNLVTDRRRQRRPILVPLEDVASPADPRPGPEDAAIGGLERARLAASIGTLRPDYQTVLRLRLVDGRSSDEVAALMGRSPGAIRVLQHRALAALRTALEKGAPR